MFSILQKIYHALLQQISLEQKPERPPTGSSPISNLPVELMLKITTQLPFDSKICLALTCKSLLELYGGSKKLLDSHELHHPKDPIEPKFGPTRTQKFCNPRWELLEILQDSRWKLCSGCLILHPVGEFSEPDLKMCAKERTCMFGPLVGLVHVCPCIKMTFRDKLRLVSELESVQPAENLRKMTSEVPSLSSGHECVYIYKDAEVRVNVTAFLEDDGEVVIKTQYSLNSFGPPDFLYSLPRLCCPHRSVYAYTLDVLGPYLYDSLYRLQSKEWEKEMVCPWCTTSIINFKSKPNTPWSSYRCSFQTLRRLGKAKAKADDTWHDQAYFSYLHIENVQDWADRNPWMLYSRIFIKYGCLPFSD